MQNYSSRDKIFRGKPSKYNSVSSQKFSEHFERSLNTPRSVTNHKLQQQMVQRVSRMEIFTLMYAVMKYQPAGRRQSGRPLERLLDCCVKTGTGHVA